MSTDAFKLTIYQLYLDDNEDAQECRIVGSVPSTAFTLWRSIALRREYESWWHSEQGSAFHAARAANDLAAVLEFDIDWAQLLHDPDDDQRAKQNRFASSTGSPLPNFAARRMRSAQPHPDKHIFGMYSFIF
ncbi:hypothetical protein K438DRAFT_1776197 [Mycena galopus ATCC 62051]|nr:hypothetical protein K438DRAFT_1776197 [Mycena galopus ATCC 62051]